MLISCGVAIEPFVKRFFQYSYRPSDSNDSKIFACFTEIVYRTLADIENIGYFLNRVYFLLRFNFGITHFNHSLLYKLRGGLV